MFWWMNLQTPSPGAENLAEEFKKSTEVVFKKHKLIE
jgi:hypothetical protein